MSWRAPKGIAPCRFAASVRVALLALTLNAIPQRAGAEIVAISDETQWRNAAGTWIEENFNGFTGTLINQVSGLTFSSVHANRPVVTSQAPQGPIPSPPNLFHGAACFTCGNGQWTVDFAVPTSAAAFWSGGVQFSGSTVQFFNSSGQLLQSFDLLASGAGHGPASIGFNGYVSDSPNISRLTVTMNAGLADWVWHDDFQWKPGAVQNGPPPGKWTVIIHGRESGDPVIERCGYPETYEELTAELPGPLGWDNWMRRLAQTIELQSTTPVNVYKMNAATLELENVNGGTGPSDPARHHVLMFDWAQTSGVADFFLSGLFCDVYTGSDNGFAYAASEALYATLRHWQADQKVFALIGYSRGAVVASEMTKRLIQAGRDPRQVIYVDGEGANGSSICGPACGNPYDPPGDPLNLYSDGVFDAWQHSGPTPIRYDNVYEMFDEDYGNDPLVDCFDLGGHCRERCANYNLACAYSHTPFLSPFLGVDRHCLTNPYVRPGIWEHLIQFMDTTGPGGEYMFPGVRTPPTPPLLDVPPPIFQLFNGDFEWGSIAGWYGNGGGTAANFPFDGGHIEADHGSRVLRLYRNVSQTHSYFALPACADAVSFEIANPWGELGALELWITSPGMADYQLANLPASSLGITLEPQGPFAIPAGFRARVCRLRFLSTLDNVNTDAYADIDNVEIHVLPSIIENPPDPIVADSSCGNATLAFSGAPPSGVSWFWQHQICATRVDLGSEPTFTVSTIGTYYLRARCDQTGEWSTGCGSMQVTGIGCGPAGDFDCNGTVEWTDFQAFAGCLDGPDNAPPPNCVDTDIEQDSDVDIRDFAVLQRTFGDTCQSIWGNALQFNTPFGNGDAVRVPEQVFNGLSDFTIEMWVYVTEAGGPTGTNCYVSFARTGMDNYFLMSSTPAGTVQATFLGSPDLLLGSPVPLNQWTHMAVSRQGTTMRLYLNGVPQTPRTVSSAALSVEPAGAFFGNDQDCVGGCFGQPDQAFTGSMDDVRVWSTALSQAAILAGMNAPLTGSEPGLRAYWRFDEPAGQLLLDSSGNGYEGNLGMTSAPAGDAFDPVRIPSSVP